MIRALRGLQQRFAAGYVFSLIPVFFLILIQIYAAHGSEKGQAQDSDLAITLGTEITAVTDQTPDFSITNLSQNVVFRAARRLARLVGKKKIEFYPDVNRAWLTDRRGRVWQVEDDGGALEITTPPYEESSLDKDRSLDHVFQVIKDVGLKTDVRMGGQELGGGHIHIGSTIFENNPMLYRNLKVTLFNQPFLQFIFETYGEDVAKTIYDHGIETEFVEFIHKTDANPPKTNSLTWLNQWLVKKLAPRTRWNKARNSDVRRSFDPKTVEFRLFRGPKDAKELKLRMKLVAHLIRHLNQFRDPIPLVILTPEQKLQASVSSYAIPQFRAWLKEIGLNPKDYESEWTSKFQTISKSPEPLLEIKEARSNSEYYQLEIIQRGERPDLRVIEELSIGKAKGKVLGSWKQSNENQVTLVSFDWENMPNEIPYRLNLKFKEGSFSQKLSGEYELSDGRVNGQGKVKPGTRRCRLADALLLAI